MPTIEVTPEIVIDQSELAFSFARAAAPAARMSTRWRQPCNCASTSPIRPLSMMR
jgi:hypothetical protein